MQRQFDATLAELLEKNNLPSCGGEYGLLLAVSGGIDSMCLAQLCENSAVRAHIIVAHCNFHLRGAESDADAAFVREWAESHGLEFHIADFDTAGCASASGISVEMAARELRYRWFGQLCREVGADAVLVAHNANDNAETLLLNLVRGTGMRGLCGMSASSPLPHSDEEVDCEEVGHQPVLLRPLLGFTRRQIEGYMRSHSLKWREDNTNADTKYKRNKVRNDVFPILESLNPSFVKTFNREMHYFSEAEDILQEYCDNATQTFCKPYCVEGSAEGSEGNAGGIKIDIPKLLTLKHWQYLLYKALEPFGFNSSTVSDLEDLLLNASLSGRTLSGKTFRSDTHILHTSSTELIVSPTVEDGVTDLEIPAPGTYTFGSSSLTVSVVPQSELSGVKPPQGTLYADAHTLRFPFHIRTWRKGDWLRPFGMSGQKKKVSDLFTDLKYNSLQKSSSGFIVRHLSDAHVLALLGKRIDESLKITGTTTDVLVITI